jgi:hypothetical protein
MQKTIQDSADVSPSIIQPNLTLQEAAKTTDYLGVVNERVVYFRFGSVRFGSFSRLGAEGLWGCSREEWGRVCVGGES